MIEENEQTPEETPEESAEDSPQSAEAGAPAADAAESAEDSPQPAEPEPEAPAEEPAAEEPVAEEPAADEAPAADKPPAAEAAAPAEPEEVVHPKQRRKRARSEHTGETRPQRSSEERVADRAAKRSRLSASRRAYRQKQREKRAASPRPEAPQVEPKEHGPGRPRVRQGIVVSAKPDKTITVRIDVARRHRTYKKIVRSSSTLHAHDESNEANEGDTVRVVETRPLSRTKRWRLVEILERAR
jgi:small subunit ribosomal protein S17